MYKLIPNSWNNFKYTTKLFPMNSVRTAYTKRRYAKLQNHENPDLHK